MMNYKFKILYLVFVLSILLGFDLNAQSTFNPSGQNTSEYTDDATTNHFFGTLHMFLTWSRPVHLDIEHAMGLQVALSSQCSLHLRSNLKRRQNV